jgi:hypothetical protein
MIKTGDPHHRRFEHSDFGFVSDFVFRISDFPTASTA